MGMYLTTYTGPIIRLKSTTKVEITKYSINICSGENAPKCPNHREGGKEISGEFCSGCGSKTKTVKKVKETPTKFNYMQFEYDNDYEDELSTHEDIPSPKGEEWLTDNMNSYYKGGDDGVCLMASQLHIDEDIKLFEERYSILIKKLIDILGSENVKIDWAVFTYYC